MSSPMFRKKSLKPVEEEEVASPIAELAQEAVDQVAQDPASDDDGSDTVRLSCDIARNRHLALRVAAAHCERTNVEMVETLIEMHLMNTSIEDIVKTYHRKRLNIRSR